jgi:hypothetical protein
LWELWFLFDGADQIRLNSMAIARKFSQQAPNSDRVYAACEVGQWRIFLVQAVNPAEPMRIAP